MGNQVLGILVISVSEVSLAHSANQDRNYRAHSNYQQKYLKQQRLMRYPTRRKNACA